MRRIGRPGKDWIYVECRLGFSTFLGKLICRFGDNLLDLSETEKTLEYLSEATCNIGDPCTNRTTC